MLDEDNDNEVTVAHAEVGKEENNTSSERVLMKDDTMVREGKMKEEGKRKEGEEENDKAGKEDRIDDASAIVKVNGVVAEEVAVVEAAGDPEEGMVGERQENDAEGEGNRVDDVSEADGPSHAIVEEDRVVEEAKRIAIAITDGAPMKMECNPGEGHGQNSAKDEKDIANDASYADGLAVTIVEEDRVVKEDERLAIGATTGAPVMRGLEGGEKQVEINAEYDEDRVGDTSAPVVVEDRVVDKAERVAIAGSASVPVEMEGKCAEDKMENYTEGQKCWVDGASTDHGPAIAVMEEDRVVDDVERVTIAGFVGTPVVMECERGVEKEENNAEAGRDIVDDVSAINDPAAVALEEDRVMDEAEQVAAFISTGSFIERKGEWGDEEKNKAADEEDRVDNFSTAKGATAVIVEEDRVADLAEVVAGAVTTCAPMVREDRMRDGQENNNVDGGDIRVDATSAAVVEDDRVENEAEQVVIIDVGGASEVIEGEVGEGQDQNNIEAESDKADDASAVDGPAAAVVEQNRVMDGAEGITIAVAADTSVVREDRGGERQDDTNAEGDEDEVEDHSAAEVPSATAVDGEKVVDEVEEVTSVISAAAPMMQEGEGEGGLEEDNKEGEQNSINSSSTISEVDRVGNLAEEVTNSVGEDGNVDGQENNNVEGGELRVEDASATVVEGDRVENEAEQVTIVDIVGASEVMKGEVGEGQDQNNTEAESDRADDASLEDDRVMDEAEGITIAVAADTSVVREDRGGEGQDDTNAEGDEDEVGDHSAAEVPSATAVDGEKVVDEVEEVTSVISAAAPMMQEGEGEGGLEEDNKEGELDSVNVSTTTSEVDRVVCEHEGGATSVAAGTPVVEENEEG